MYIETTRVKSPISDDNPLGFVVINTSDLTEDHELFDAAPDGADVKLTIAQIRDALAARGIGFDPAAKKADLQVLLDAA